jgi:hypothetical protein
MYTSIHLRLHYQQNNCSYDHHFPLHIPNRNHIFLFNLYTNIFSINLQNVAKLNTCSVSHLKYFPWFFNNWKCYIWNFCDNKSVYRGPLRYCRSYTLKTEAAVSFERSITAYQNTISPVYRFGYQSCLNAFLCQLKFDQYVRAHPKHYRGMCHPNTSPSVFIYVTKLCFW